MEFATLTPEQIESCLYLATEGDIRYYLHENPNPVFLAATLEDQIVASLSIEPDCPDPTLEIQKPYQGMGIEAELMCHSDGVLGIQILSRESQCSDSECRI